MPAAYQLGSSLFTVYLGFVLENSLRTGGSEPLPSTFWPSGTSELHLGSFGVDHPCSFLERSCSVSASAAAKAFSPPSSMEFSQLFLNKSRLFVLRIQIRSTSLTQMRSPSRERHSHGSHRHVVALPHSDAPAAGEGKRPDFHI